MGKRTCVVLTIIMAFCVAGCSDGHEEQAKTPYPVQKEEHVEKKFLKMPEEYDKTEFLTGNFTRSRDGKLELFLKTERSKEEGGKIFYYDLDEEGNWIKLELENEEIKKRLTWEMLGQNRVNQFQRGSDGNLYCIYETEPKRDMQSMQEDWSEDTRLYLVNLGEDGTGFEKHRLTYCNSGDFLEGGVYMPLDSYDVLEDGRVLLRYADNHCELYSQEQKKVVKVFSEKTAKYGLYCVGDEIYRAGEDWMSMDVIDTNTEETIQTFPHNFKRLSGQGTYIMDGCDSRCYLLDGNGIHFMNMEKDTTFETIEATNGENKFDEGCVIHAFGADEYGNVYVYYETAPQRGI